MAILLNWLKLWYKRAFRFLPVNFVTMIHLFLDLQLLWTKGSLRDQHECRVTKWCDQWTTSLAKPCRSQRDWVGRWGCSGCVWHEKNLMKHSGRREEKEYGFLSCAGEKNAGVPVYRSKVSNFFVFLHFFFELVAILVGSVQHAEACPRNILWA